MQQARQREKQELALRDEVMSRFDGIVEQLRNDRELLTRELEKRNQDIEEIKETLAERDQLLRKKEMRLMKLRVVSVCFFFFLHFQLSICLSRLSLFFFLWLLPPQLEGSMAKEQRVHDINMTSMTNEGLHTRIAAQRNALESVELQTEIGKLQQELVRLQMQLKSYKVC